MLLRTSPILYTWLNFILLLPLFCNAQFGESETSIEAISLRSKTSILLAGQQNYSFEEIRNNTNLEFVPLSSLKENLN